MTATKKNSMLQRGCLWLGVLMSISGSLIRSFNIGHQTESYILSALSHVPLLFATDTWALFVYNVGHVTIDLIGICSHYGAQPLVCMLFMITSAALLLLLMWMKQFRTVAAVVAVKTKDKPS